MAGECLVIHSKGLSSTVQVVDGTRSVLIGAGGDPRIRVRGEDPFGNVPLSRFQPEMLVRAAHPILPMYEPRQPNHPQNLAQLRYLLEGRIGQEQTQLVLNCYKWQHKQGIGVNEIIIPEAHRDSTSALPIIRPEIPTVMSSGTYSYLNALSCLRPGVMTDRLSVRRYNKDGTRLQAVDRQIIELKQGESHNSPIGNVLLHGVNHILGSTAVILNDGQIVFTSDIGQGLDTMSLLEAYPHPDILFFDATHLGRPDELYSGALDLNAQLNKYISDNKGDNFIIQAPRHDTNRLKGIIEIAKKLGKRVVLSWQLAAFYELVSEGSDENKLQYDGILLTPRGTNTFSKKDYPTKIRSNIFESGHQILTPQELASGSGSRTITVIEDQTQFKHLVHGPRDQCIYAGYPLTRSELIRLRRVAKEAMVHLENFGASSHLSHEALMHLLGNMSSRVIVPMHTSNPRAAASAIEDSGGNFGKIVQNVVIGHPIGYDGKKLKI